jgi:hypothetical protein
MISAIDYQDSCLSSFLKNMRKSACAAFIVFVLSCSCQKQAEPNRNSSLRTGTPGTTQSSTSTITGPYALEISPKSASRDSTVNLIVTGFAASDAKIEWLLNGLPEESALSYQFNLSQAKKGDTLQARTRIQGREILSNIVEIANAPPEITSIKLHPELVAQGNTLSVDVAGSDIDGDPVTFLYEWTKNGEPAGNAERIEAPLKRGDRISVKVTPFDGESYGRSVVLDNEIQNLPPIIQEHQDFKFDGKVYTYQVKATDPDGDPLIYTIESPAEGMTINASSGLITWNVPSEFKGKKSVSVVVTDGYGGAARYVLNITIQ